MNTHIERQPAAPLSIQKPITDGPVLNKSINMTEERTLMLQKWVSGKAKLGWSANTIRREAFRNFSIKVTFS
jgi:hypothetical protein